MTEGEALPELAATCPNLARKLGQLPPEQLQTILTEKTDKDFANEHT